MSPLEDYMFVGSNFWYKAKLNVALWIIILYYTYKLFNYEVATIKIMSRLWGQYTLLLWDTVYFIMILFYWQMLSRYNFEVILPEDIFLGYYYHVWWPKSRPHYIVHNVDNFC